MVPAIISRPVVAAVKRNSSRAAAMSTAPVAVNGVVRGVMTVDCTDAEVGILGEFLRRDAEILRKVVNG